MSGKNKTKKIEAAEILAPAGSLEILKGAFEAGADAVYAGGSCFGARAFAQNFTEKELMEGIDYAHLHGKKLYLTVNTLIKEKEFDSLYQYLLPLYRQGLDAVIVQDQGAVDLIREAFPLLAVHASTQMTVTNAVSAAFLEKRGLTRVVPARELSLPEIRKIADETDLEIECFVHGALCYCYSGRCLMSSMIGGRSGNRGQCAQPCRLPWKTDPHKPAKDLLSLKDLCTIDLVPDLLQAGITSFKIEGRMKQPLYVETVTAMYRKYMDLYMELQNGGRGNFRVSDEDRNTLLSAYQRRGYTDGYYRRHNGKEMLSLERPRTESAAREVKSEGNPKLQEKINGKLTLSPGKNAKLDLTCETGGKLFHISAEGGEVQEALKRPMEKEQLLKQMKKTGNTPFTFQSMDISLDGSIFMPVQSVNALRREGLEKLQNSIIESFRRTAEVQPPAAVPRAMQNHAAQMADIPVFVSVMSVEQGLAAVKQPFVKRIYISDTFLDEGDAELLVKEAEEKKIPLYFIMPQIYRREAEEACSRRLPVLMQICSGAMVHNLESLLRLRQEGFDKPADTSSSAYAWNLRAQRFWRGLGADLISAPLELNAGELQDLDRTGMILPVYGYEPVMVSAGCIRRNTQGCTGKSGWMSVTDRYQKKFMVRNECAYCYNIIYNTDPLVLLDQKEEILSLSPAALLCSFTWERGKRTEEILAGIGESIFSGRQLQWEDGFTRGHFKRGVK